MEIAKNWKSWVRKCSDKLLLLYYNKNRDNVLWKLLKRTKSEQSAIYWAQNAQKCPFWVSVLIPQVSARRKLNTRISVQRTDAIRTVRNMLLKLFPAANAAEIESVELFAGDFLKLSFTAPESATLIKTCVWFCDNPRWARQSFVEDAFIFFKTAAAATQTQVFAVCLSLGTASETVSLVQKGRQLAEGSDLRDLRVRENETRAARGASGKTLCTGNHMRWKFCYRSFLSFARVIFHSRRQFCFRRSSG